MSFVKKTLKKVWNFVKKHWKTIVLVAAIAFTAGVATIGFSAFVGGGLPGFISAVGQTMWAGVAGTAGSLGIGQGATVGAGGMTAAGGTAVAAGTKVGLGAAWGAGGGYGLGKAGHLAAQKGIEAGTTQAYGAAYDKAIAKGLSKEAAREAGMGAAKGAAADLTGAGTNALTKVGATAAKSGGGGMTLSGAADLAGKLAPVAGAWAMAKGQEDQLNQYNTDAAFGGNQFTGRDASGGPGPAKNFLEPQPVEGGQDPAEAATGLMNQRKESLYTPYRNVVRAQMGQKGATGRGLDGRLTPEEDYLNQGLMARAV